jgi:hypothetical protein
VPRARGRQFAVAYEPDHIHLARVTQPRLFENRFASPQPFLLAATGVEWRLAIKAERYKRRPKPDVLGQQQHQPGDAHNPLRGQQGATDIGHGPGPRVMADGQALVGQAEDGLEGDHVAGQAHRMDLRAGDGRPARFADSMGLLDGPVQVILRDRGQFLGQLARGAARRVHFVGMGVINDLPRRQLCGRYQGKAFCQGGRDRKVAGGDHAQVALAGARVKLVVILRREAGGVDDHAQPVVERGKGARFD